MEWHASSRQVAPEEDSQLLPTGSKLEKGNDPPAQIKAVFVVGPEKSGPCRRRPGEDDGAPARASPRFAARRESAENGIDSIGAPAYIGDAPRMISEALALEESGHAVT